MARSDDYPGDEPTRRLGGYGNPAQPGPPHDPWYRKPVALVSFGAAGAVLIALVVYALAALITGGSDPGSGTTTSLTPLTSTQTVVPPSTITETVTAEPTTAEPTTTTTTEPTTTTTTTTTSPSVSVSTSTVTQTETETETVTEAPQPQP